MRRFGVLTLLPAILLGACAQMEQAARRFDEVAAQIVPAPSQSEAERRYRQGLRHLNGEGVPVDARKAVVEFQAAAGEIPDAAFLLGLAYRSGQGVARDDAAAVTWFRKAADAGHIEALYMMGLSSLRGLGTAQDFAAARSSFEKAAAQGHAGAQYHLGLMFASGLGMARDDGAALAWLDKAAAQNHPEAQFALAEAHTNGRGTPVDHAWAERWYAKAAAQGVVRAQYMLGVAYATGLGSPKDLAESLRWLSLAANKGDRDAPRLRDAVATRLTVAQREAAHGWAERWRPSAPGPFADAPTIRFAQFALGRLGYEAGPPDGIWGPQTERAVAAFRQRTALSEGTGLTTALLQRLKDERLRRGR